MAANVELDAGWALKSLGWSPGPRLARWPVIDQRSGRWGRRCTARLAAPREALKGPQGRGDGYAGGKGLEGREDAGSVDGWDERMGRGDDRQEG